VDAVMKGYYKAPEATAAVLDADGWYYTGDLATMDDQGYMRIVGRKSDMIKRSGQCIFPKEIEDSLATHPQIADVAVLGVPGVLGSEQVWAYVVPQDGAELTAKAVVEYCRGRIAPYKTPEEVRIVSELPKAAATGKTQKHKLRDLAIEEHRRKREVRSEEVR
jgi:fatty-acyl-CoA synthase